MYAPNFWGSPVTTFGLILFAVVVWTLVELARYLRAKRRDLSR